MIRPVAILAVAAMVGACAPSEQQPAMQEEAPAPGLTLAALAGTWNMKATLNTPDTTVVNYTMTGGADAASWTITLPNRQPMPVRVTVAGDSAVFEVAPYESILRKGVMVSTRSVGRMSAGSMTGTMVARYQTTAADSVVRGRFEGTRTP